MYTEGFEQWFKNAKNMSVPFNEWNKAATDILRRTTQENIDLLGDNLSLFSDQLKRMSNAKKPEDFINIQKDCINEGMSAAIESMQKIVNLSMKNMEEITKLYGSALREQTRAAQKSTQDKSEK